MAAIDTREVRGGGRMMSASITYDPLVAPDGDAWLNEDEAERLDVILAYHLEEFGEDDNLTAHAAVHGVVENQIAMWEEFPTRQTVERLMKEGIDWHEAIHAVGSVVMAQRWDARKDGRIFDEARYCEEFRDFTVAKWRAAYED